MSQQQKNAKLNDGHEMPYLGLGTWQSKPGEVANAIKVALKNGYKLIDCAYVYENQSEIGKALKEVFAEGKVKREDVFITSKVWNTFHPYDLALKNIDIILEELQLEYLDLCLIHWPTAFKEGKELFPMDPNNTERALFSDADYLETWRALEEAVHRGKVRSIGLSNFNIQQIERVKQNAKIQPAVLQVELHPFFQQKELVDFCKKNGIVVTSYSSFCNPTSPFPKPKDVDTNVHTNPIITAIAKKHGKTNAQVVLKALVQRGIAVIPKSVTESRIIQNAQIWDFSLDEDDLKQFESLDSGIRLLQFKPVAEGHPYFPW